MVSVDDSRVSTEELVGAVQDAEFFRSLVENGSDAIVSVDETSTILYANESVERVFGYAPEEMIGERLTMIMPERFRSAHFEALSRYLETGERQLDWNDIELPAKHKDGHEVPLSITFEEHTYEGERVFSGIMRDISDRVEREEALARQNERLEQFASIVSHDLRDPLNTARATADLVAAGEREAVEDLYDTFDQMETLIEDVLALAREGQEIGERERVALSAVAEDAWETAGTDAATLRVDDGLGHVSADPDRLRVLFQNLFRNAIEHGGESVTVEVGPLHNGGDGEGPLTGFYVADDGVGLSEEDTETLFEYGYTTANQGTGLGLNIVRQVVEAHGWSVTATTATRVVPGSR